MNDRKIRQFAVSLEDDELQPMLDYLIQEIYSRRDITTVYLQVSNVLPIKDVSKLIDYQIETLRRKLQSTIFGGY